MKSAKGDITNQVFTNAGRGSLELMGKTADMTVVIKDSNDDVICSLPLSSNHRKTNELFSPLLEDNYQYELAKEFGVTAAYLSYVLSETDPHPATSDMLLCCLLRRDPVPNLEQTNDILWHHRRPGLFTQTYIPAVNRRNYICGCLMEYAHHNPTAQDNWIDFAGNVLAYAEMETLDHKMYPGELEEALPMVERWIAEANALPVCSYSPLRKAFFDRYCRRLGLSGWGSSAKGRRNILNALSVQLSENTLANFFAKTTNENSKGSRSTIIEIAVAMGCTREEADEMLMQANECLLYPGCENFPATQQELCYIEQLNRNAMNCPD